MGGDGSTDADKRANVLKHLKTILRRNVHTNRRLIKVSTKFSKSFPLIVFVFMISITMASN